jgi:TolB protein
LGSGLLVLAVLAGGGAASLAVMRQQPAAPPLTPSTRVPSVLPAGQVGPRSAVPWSHVGPGWTLAGYTPGWPYAGRPGLRKPTILYLVDPLGGRYQMHRWPASQPGGWGLLDWSGDGTRALLVSVTDGRWVMHQLVLATGALRSFTLPAGAYPIGYARPDGSSLLAVSGKTVTGHGVVQRFGLTGALQATLGTGDGAVSSPDGATVAMGTPTGIEMAAVAGGRARRVTISGVNPWVGCHPVRWWDASTVLADCQTRYASASQLWLVPANGGRASALTAAPGLRPGYSRAWQLRSGLYLLGMAGDGCGTVMVRQAADGPAARVSGQGSGAMDVLAVAGGRMLVKWERTCSSGWSLTWFNPATGAAATLLPAPADGQGVTDAIPYGGEHG